MPELPEVQTVVTSLRPVLVGETIARIKHVRDDMISPEGFDLRRALRRKKIVSIDRRAKRIVFTLHDGNRFYIHLGMSGRLTAQPRSSPIEKHTHLIAAITKSKLELRFRDPRRFGGIFWLGAENIDESKSLGPEPLSLRADVLRKRLARTHRPIKNALMDQRFIAGLGNIYVDESLHRAGIHPLRFADEIDAQAVNKLTRAIKHVLRRAIDHRGSTLRDYVDGEGKRGGFQLMHSVYGRGGMKCRRCESEILRITLGGRSTHFCPSCQR